VHAAKHRLALIKLFEFFRCLNIAKGMLAPSETPFNGFHARAARSTNDESPTTRLAFYYLAGHEFSRRVKQESYLVHRALLLSETKPQAVIDIVEVAHPAFTCSELSL
jgi:hypothetical protein